jgi:large subunit ribosomal protein L15
MMVRGFLMRLDELKPPEGARKKRKRVGRGIGSGHGKTACKGSKGQNSRSGRGTKAGFEGGQMPLQRRLPKRGFRSPFKKHFAIIHVGDLNRFPEGSVVEPSLLLQSGLLKKEDRVKLLSDGELQHPLTIRVHQASKAALKKVESASGRVEVIGS